jgi:hypothetical protein
MSTILHHLDARAYLVTLAWLSSVLISPRAESWKKRGKGARRNVQTQSGTEGVPQMSAKSSACPASARMILPFARCVVSKDLACTHTLVALLS